jgi:ubiquinone/menaquinone biosynthesis C-methylase UbiE
MHYLEGTCMLEKFACPKCKNHLNIDLKKDHYHCDYCEFKGDIVNSIPVFVPQQKTKLKKGIGESIFRLPRCYKMFAALKHIVYKDKTLGVNEFVTGREVLDVGCGPSLQLKHLEYSPKLARTLTAIDVSLPFVTAAKAENIGPQYTFAAGSITEIPFKDKSFDTSIVSFVIHHVPEEPKKVFEELIRVTKKHIVVFDHLRSENYLENLIQSSYWNIFDGGCNYLTKTQWSQLFKGFKVIKYQPTGAIFSHVVKFVLELN